MKTPPHQANRTMTMRDMFLGAIILGWTYMAAHAGTLHISGLFDLVNATLDHVLAQIG